MSEWVETVAERLQLLRNITALKGEEDAGICQQRLRTFNIGEKVLYRIPGLACKLAGNWECQYVVREKLGDVKNT